MVTIMLICVVNNNFKVHLWNLANDNFSVPGQISMFIENFKIN